MDSKKLKFNLKNFKKVFRVFISWICFSFQRQFNFQKATNIIHLFQTRWPWKKKWPWRRRNERLWNSQSAYSFLFYDFDTIVTLATGHLQIYANEYVWKCYFSTFLIVLWTIFIGTWLTTFTTGVVYSRQLSSIYENCKAYC